MKPSRMGTRWQTLAVLSVVVPAAFSIIVWWAEKSGGACRNSRGYLCSLISPKNLPRDYLVLIGIGGIFVAISTLKSIHHQALQVKRQTKILKNSANAAKDAADAAKQNIELFVSKERARLSVELKPLNLEERAIPDASARLIEFTVSNCGSTAARVLDSRVASGIVIKGQEDDPDLGSAIMSQVRDLPSQILPGAPPLERYTFLIFEESKETMMLDAIQQEDMVPFVRGFVRYRDIFDATWTLRFRYYWGPLPETSALGLRGFLPDVRHGQWNRCGPPEDNQENQN